MSEVPYPGAGQRGSRIRRSTAASFFMPKPRFLESRRLVGHCFDRVTRWHGGYT